MVVAPGAVCGKFCQQKKQNQDPEGQNKPRNAENLSGVCLYRGSDAPLPSWGGQNPRSEACGVTDPALGRTLRRRGVPVVTSPGDLGSGPEGAEKWLEPLIRLVGAGVGEGAVVCTR